MIPFTRWLSPKYQEYRDRYQSRNEILNVLGLPDNA